MTTSFEQRLRDYVPSEIGHLHLAIDGFPFGKAELRTAASSDSPRGERHSPATAARRGGSPPPS